VNWRIYTRFGRALCLRWLWHSWDEDERSWRKLLLCHNKIDCALFFASTVVTVDNGMNTPFWEASWLNGAAPKDLVLNLYQHARCKYKMVHKEIQNLNRIKNLRSLNTQELLDEIFLLFATVSKVALSEDRYTIAWH
jgi:hypothetical protein